jgi:hypothetical protein
MRFLQKGVNLKRDEGVPNFWGVLADCKQYFDSKSCPTTEQDE